MMLLIIDGYNLLHAGRSSLHLNPQELQRQRERLIDELSAYGRRKSCKITVVFDGWQGGWVEETREKKKGIEIIFSKMGEKADEVIKRLVKEKGAGAVLITSDRDVQRHAEKISVPVLRSDQFREKMGNSANEFRKDLTEEEEDLRELKRKGPSRKLSKKEKRMRTALKKL
jgi:predicted RNA-binding protein with PIN domain